MTAFAIPIVRRIVPGMLKPDAMNASSRSWEWYVNVFAASPLLRGRERQLVYQDAEFELDTDRVGPACYFHTSAMKIGRGTLVNHGCHFENVAPIGIGENSALSMYVTVLTSNHEIGGPDKRFAGWTHESVCIGSGCGIGARATILPGVTIGDGCVIAAGAVVTEDCEENGLYAGVPARRVRDLPV